MSIGIYNIDDYINNTEIDFNEKKNEFIRKLIRDFKDPMDNELLPCTVYTVDEDF